MSETFREQQRFTQVWLWVLLAVVVGVGWWAFVQQIILGKPFGNNPGPDWVVWLVWALIAVGVPLLFWALRLTVVVDRKGVHARYRPFVNRRIPFKDIESCEAVTYRPIRDYGGWGIRWRPKRGWIYNVSGNRGVRLKFKNGKQLMIGSQRADELAQAIQAGLARRR